EIAVAQLFGRGPARGRRRHHAGEVADRRRRDDMTRLILPRRAVRLFCGDGPDRGGIIAGEADDALVHAELAAHLDHLARGLLPQHPGAAARVAEALDEGLDAAVAALAIEAAQHAVPDPPPQAPPLPALPRPVAAHVVARHAPDLLGLGTKQDRIEPLAELVAHPFVERA